MVKQVFILLVPLALIALIMPALALPKGSGVAARDAGLQTLTEPGHASSPLAMAASMQEDTQPTQVNPAQDEAFRLDPAAPHYANARYGFSLSLPPGTYSAFGAGNGDGITIEDGRGLLLRAYGTMAPGVLGQGFEEVLAAMVQGFDTVTYRKSDSQAGWFVLSGYRGGSIGYVKCFFRGNNACIVDISYPKADKARYNALVKTVVRSFVAPSTAGP